jgi:hypothetical protein
MYFENISNESTSLGFLNCERNIKSIVKYNKKYLFLNRKLNRINIKKRIFKNKKLFIQRNNCLILKKIKIIFFVNICKFVHIYFLNSAEFWRNSCPG